MKEKFHSKNFRKMSKETKTRQPIGAVRKADQVLSRQRPTNVSVKSKRDHATTLRRSKQENETRGWSSRTDLKRRNTKNKSIKLTSKEARNLLNQFYWILLWVSLPAHSYWPRRCFILFLFSVIYDFYWFGLPIQRWSSRWDVLCANVNFITARRDYQLVAALVAS